MSTVIRPNPDHGNTVELRGHGSTVDVFALTDREAVTFRAVPRADFLAAVAAECGVIVINRADLPAVIVDRHGLHVDGLNADNVTTRNDALREARALLALAEYVKDHPPIDEALVEALAEDILRVDVPVNNGSEWPHSWARRLIAAGWSK